MNKEIIIDEIKMCNSILEKFKEEMLDCKTDYEKLKELQDRDGNNPNFKRALLAVKERYDDITLSVKLIKSRVEKLQEDLKGA